MSAVQQLRASGAGSQPLWWERVAWEHPEWWSLALSALAWAAIVVRTASPEGGSVSHPHADHAAAAMLQSGRASLMLAEAVDWLLMVGAMMFPLLSASIGTTAARSLWTRRHRAIGFFLAGYVIAWMLAGSLIVALMRVVNVDQAGQSSMWAAAGFTIAALWQLTRTKLRALRACHRTMPLAPRGWRADRDCLRYGWTIGGRCVVSCWAMMAACVFAAHGIPAMLCATAVASAERFLPRLDRRVTASVLLGFALLQGTLSLLRG